MKPRGFANIIIIIAALVALSAIASTYLVLENQKAQARPEPRACTMEAKQCPDGSYVGRGGPNCEFATCPVAATTQCNIDSDCKLIYSGCGCQAVPRGSSQTSFDDGRVCIRNSCMPPTPVTAVCQQNKCVRSDQTQVTTVGTLKVTSPAEGDTWLAGHAYAIAWQSSPSLLGKAFETVTISLAPPRPACLDSVPRCLIAEMVPYTIADGVIGKGVYQWAIPADLPSRYFGSQQVTVMIKETGAYSRSSTFTISH